MCFLVSKWRVGRGQSHGFIHSHPVRTHLLSGGSIRCVIPPCQESQSEWSLIPLYYWVRLTAKLGNLRQDVSKGVWSLGIFGTSFKWSWAEFWANLGQILSRVGQILSALETSFKRTLAKLWASLGIDFKGIQLGWNILSNSSQDLNKDRLVYGFGWNL